ncbi:FtsX-like permease family protein [Streptomyces sp. NPDC002057]|uniref:FtsX-like permease family protein n=1 Tax=Streptomyces sp. NPDC002057 TaxID=3154664 RepID=UPI0033333552
MLALALRSLRFRPGRLLATLLVTFLGASIIMAFNSMHDTARAEDVDDVSAETLGLVAGVVGGYGTLLVFFAVASTMTVNVRQRGDEIALLRSTGATPAQVRLMIVGESAAVAVIGSLLAVGPGMLGGRLLLDMFQDSGQVAGDVEYGFGLIALLSGVDVTLLASVGAAFLAVRRATRNAAGAATASRKRGRVRVLLGSVAVAAGASGVCLTLTFDPDDPSLMAPAAYGAIVIAVGLALLAPLVLRSLTGRFAGLLAGLAGVSGYLTAHNLRQRAAQQSGVLMPLIVFTGMATATVYMQAIGNDALEASGVRRSVADKNLETINLVVVGIVVAFACVMLVNSLYAATSDRGREFGQQRLAGATPGQVLSMVAAEGLVLTVLGVVFGTVAGIAGILPFNAVRTDAVLPDQGPGIWLGIVAIAAGATLITTLCTAVRVLRTPAIDAVAVTA